MRNPRAMAAHAWMVSAPKQAQARFYATRGPLRRRQIVGRYLEEADVPRLAVGAGTNRLDGWLHSDIYVGDIYMDLTKPLPLPDASFQYVYGEQVIEHISEPAAVNLFGELHRVIRPGGVVRLATPDMEAMIALYRDELPGASRAEFAAYLDTIADGPHDTPAQIFNSVMRSWGHEFLYDELDLAEKLRAAGFRHVARQEPGQSPHEHLRGVERNVGAVVGLAATLCVEATP